MIKIKELKFSLIMATYGREKEVEEFFSKLKINDYPKEKIEVIVVDQNDKINLKPIIKKYKDDFKIIYIKSEVKGLARNRNIGLTKATGDIIAFPDDDCEYINDTLVKVNNYLNTSDSNIVMGRIIERDGSDSLRTWRKENFQVNKNNFYTSCSSITMFIKKENSALLFNEDLGAGTKFGSCEDSDILYKNLKANNKVLYKNDIKIYHPHYDSNVNMSREKIYNYGLGFGAFVKSNLDINTVMLFVKAQGYHMAKTLFYLLTFKLDKCKNSYTSFISRINGLISY